MITVSCVLWGSKFSLDYVYNLKRAVEENTTIPHEFVCFTDKEIPGITSIILDPGYEGWWNKLQLFNTTKLVTDRMVYLDLDTIITGNLDWLLQYDGKFMGIEDVGAVNAHQPHLKNQLQSGVMAWNYYANSYIWNELSKNKNITTRFRGDGELLNTFIQPLGRDLLQHLYPGKLKSYKYQVYPDKLTPETSIVCFHGRPSIIEAISKTIATPMKTFHPQQWIKKYWRDNA